MQDKAPAYNARLTKAEFMRLGVTLMNWPSNSPDLNPIEALWDQLKDYLQREFGDRRLSLGEIKAGLQEAWNLVTSDRIRNLTGSMRRRCEAVIKNMGGHTDY